MVIQLYLQAIAAQNCKKANAEYHSFLLGVKLTILVINIVLSLSTNLILLVPLPNRYSLWPTPHLTKVYFRSS